jgi:hypothetical protein
MPVFSRILLRQTLEGFVQSGKARAPRVGRSYPRSSGLKTAPIVLVALLSVTIIASADPISPATATQLTPVASGVPNTDGSVPTSISTAERNPTWRPPVQSVPEPATLLLMGPALLLLARRLRAR